MSVTQQQMEQALQVFGSDSEVGRLSLEEFRRDYETYRAVRPQSRPDTIPVFIAFLREMLAAEKDCQMELAGDKFGDYVPSAARMNRHISQVMDPIRYRVDDFIVALKGEKIKLYSIRNKPGRYIMVCHSTKNSRVRPVGSNDSFLVPTPDLAEYHETCLSSS
jgi:hypothetical protein